MENENLTKLESMIHYENDKNVTLVDARMLHNFLGIGKVFGAWIIQMIDYGFEENTDYFEYFPKKEKTSKGGRPRKDYALTIDTAKEICMIQRNDKGRQARKYFIECEKKLSERNKIKLPDFTDPVEAARAWADAIESKQIAEAQVKEMKPKAEFHDAIVASEGSISIGDFAKILRKNGIKIGRNRLFSWFRSNGYMMYSNKTNIPTQRSVESGYFEVTEYPFELNSGKKVVTTTSKITGKGQKYFISMFKKRICNYI